MRVLRNFVWWIIRGLLGLRYRVQLKGNEQLDNLQGPTLILPNHPGNIDPLLVMSNMAAKLAPRPLLAEMMFQTPALYPLMILLNAIRLPELRTASAEAQARANQAIQEVIDTLKAGDNIIMWPAGRIQRQGYEVLGGAQALTKILKEVPEANIIRLRARGLWGSRLTYAYTGKVPNLGGQILAGMGWLLASGMFFMPRRQVTITVDRVERSELPELEREKINPFFEAWYNEGGPDEPIFVPYHHWFGPRSRDFPEYTGLEEVDPSKIKDETKKRVAELLAEQLKRPLTEKENQPDVMLDALGMDSLGRMEISVEVERAFGFSGSEVPLTIGHLWALAEGLSDSEPVKPAPPEWSKPLSETGPAEIRGDTVLEAFLYRALASPRDVVVADDISGVLTFEKVLAGVVMLSKRLKTIAAPNVGLMLPASASSDISYFALLAAGKLPVLLNWTTGPANLAHSADLLELTHVVTSRRFIDRKHIEVKGVEYLYLEDLQKDISWWEKLTTLLAVRYRGSTIPGRLAAAEPDKPAVVLFTSGSEKAPKAVPLTHRNLLNNQRAGMEALRINRQDSVLGFLPAFHSFGLSVTGLVPLLAGLRVVRHPDPTDTAGVVRKLAAYKPTLLLATPTFLSYIFERAAPEELDSLRIIVVGAEKCPKELFTKCSEMVPNALLLEGYGATECSPVVTLNRPDAHKANTVGMPLANVEVCFIDPEKDPPVPNGKQGRILVTGPSVFPGYIGYKKEDQPFKELNGKHWYDTGDLGELDDEGYVHFKGRLKRFLKAGGEMISLGALEAPFQQLYPTTKETGPRVAVEGIQEDLRGYIVLFCTEELSLTDANAHLREAGFHGIMRLDDVRKVESIPLLGTGKTDYKVLRAQIEKERAAVVS